jgi:hypothetical protein
MTHLHKSYNEKQTKYGPINFHMDATEWEICAAWSLLNELQICREQHRAGSNPFLGTAPLAKTTRQLRFTVVNSFPILALAVVLIGLLVGQIKSRAAAADIAAIQAILLSCSGKQPYAIKQKSYSWTSGILTSGNTRHTSGHGNERPIRR